MLFMPTPHSIFLKTFISFLLSLTSQIITFDFRNNFSIACVSNFFSVNSESTDHKMVRPPCCDKMNVKKGLWTEEEDAKILAYVSKHGTGNWTAVPKKAGN